ncbi:MAG: hypothetical protein JO015_13180 [Verrucomicrobia bacterium]|nr:hypothetical protein [Verrucomicrobiota bacterium]
MDQAFSLEVERCSHSLGIALIMTTSIADRLSAPIDNANGSLVRKKAQEW